MRWFLCWPGLGTLKLFGSLKFHLELLISLLFPDLPRETLAEWLYHPEVWKWGPGWIWTRQYSEQSYEADVVSNSILQMKKLRLGEVQQLTPNHEARKWLSLSLTFYIIQLFMSLHVFPETRPGSLGPRGIWEWMAEDRQLWNCAGFPLQTWCLKSPRVGPMEELMGGVSLGCCGPGSCAGLHGYVKDWIQSLSCSHLA